MKKLNSDCSYRKINGYNTSLTIRVCITSSSAASEDICLGGQMQTTLVLRIEQS